MGGQMTQMHKTSAAYCWWRHRKFDSTKQLNVHKESTAQLLPTPLKCQHEQIDHH